MKVGRAFRLLTALLVLTVAGTSCTQDSSTAPEAVTLTPDSTSIDASLLGDLLGGVGSLVGNLLVCSPMPFQAGEAVIGPNGGTLRLGPHTLTVPRGALDRNVRIRGELPVSVVNSIRFSPEGLEFKKSTTLTMSYSNCSLTAGLLTPKRIAYTSEQLQILEYIPSTDNILARKVTGRLDHFSRYAVSW
jgi:hypothetical protein